MLPRRLDGHNIRHAVEIRHASFISPAFVGLLRKQSVAAVLVDSDKHPMVADVTGDFVYVRLQRTVKTVKTGYTAGDLDIWARRTQVWADGGTPDDLALIAGSVRPKKTKRDVFVYMIAGAKEKAPAAAMALIERVL